MENLILSFDPQPPIITYQSPTFVLDTAANQVSIDNKLRSFSSLPVGWHFGEGVPPSNELISRVIEINNYVYRLGFSKTDAFPGISGNIMLTIYQGEHLIDLTVESDCKTATYLYEKNGENIADKDDIELSTAIKMIEQVGEVCRLSEPYTRSITLNLNTGSKVLLLKHLIRGEHLFFPQNVPWSVLETFVNTSIDITSQLGSPVMQPFTGSLMTISFPRDATENQK